MHHLERPDLIEPQVSLGSQDSQARPHHDEPDKGCPKPERLPRRPGQFAIQIRKATKATSNTREPNTKPALRRMMP